MARRPPGRPTSTKPSSHGRPKSEYKEHSRRPSRQISRERSSARDSNERVEKRLDGETAEDPHLDAVPQNAIWRYLFLLVAIGYVGLSAYIFVAKVWGQMDSIQSGASTAQSSADKSTRSLITRAIVSRAQASADDVGDLSIRFFGTIALALGTSSAAFFLAVFYPRWIFHVSAATLTICGAAAISVGIMKGAMAAMSNFWLALIVAPCLWVYWRKRLEPTYAMLRCVRLLTSHNSRFYLLVLGSMVLQTLLAIWTTFSISIGVIQFIPNGPSCGDSPCGLGIVLCLVIFYVIAYLWMANTIAEIVHTTLAGSYYSRCLYQGAIDTRARTHLAVQLWAQLGTRARNAILSDFLEQHCWLFTNLDRVPLLRRLYAFCCYPFNLLTRNFMESYNRYVGIVAATHNYEVDYVECKETAYSFVKRGHAQGAVDPEHRGIGRDMGKMQELMRTERESQKRLPDSHWKTGLGAFMESHQTKSILVIAAVACAVLSECFVFILTYGVVSEGQEPTSIQGSLLGWSASLTLIVAYYTMTAVEAGVCTLQVWLYDPWQGTDIIEIARRDPDLNDLHNYLVTDLQLGPSSDATWAGVRRPDQQGV